MKDSRDARTVPDRGDAAHRFIEARDGMAPDRWFCVEDCTDQMRPVTVLAEGDLDACQEFIRRQHQRFPGHRYRIGYSAVLRQRFGSRRDAA